MTKSELFKTAHEMARTFTGDYRARFALALKLIREGKKEMNRYKVTCVKRGNALLRNLEPENVNEGAIFIEVEAGYENEAKLFAYKKLQEMKNDTHIAYEAILLEENQVEEKVEENVEMEIPEDVSKIRVWEKYGKKRVYFTVDNIKDYYFDVIERKIYPVKSFGIDRLTNQTRKYFEANY